MPPSPAQRVADRIQCLYARYLRAHAEAIKVGRDPCVVVPVEMSVGEQLDLCRSVLRDARLRQALTPEERKALAAPAGSLRIMDVRAGLYCSDSLDVLVEALSGIKPTKPGQRVYCVTSRRLPPSAFLGPAIAPWLAMPRLVSVSSLRRLHQLNEAYAWRLRVYVLSLTGAFLDVIGTGNDFAESLRRQEAVHAEVEVFLSGVVARRAAACERAGLFEARKGDFPVGRTTFQRYIRSQLRWSEREEQAVAQRLRAATWLLRTNTSWSTARAPSPMGFAIPARLRGRGSASLPKHLFDPRVDLASFRSMR